MPPIISRDRLPKELNDLLEDGEDCYYYSPVAFKGGCLSFVEKTNYWVALSDKRLLYRAKIKTSDSTVQHYYEREGTIPFEKISHIEVGETTQSGCIESEALGCMTNKYWGVNINVQGAIIHIPLPNKGDGSTLRALFYQIQEEKENK